MSIDEPSTQFGPSQVDESIKSEDPVSETKTTLPEPIPPINSKSIHLNLNVIDRLFVLDEKELAALENIFIDTVYFLIKSGNEENVSLAKAKVRIL